MLTGGTLTIVTAANNDSVTCCLGALRECGITYGETELRQERNIGTVGQNFRAGGHNMVSSNIILNLQHQLCGQFVGKGLALGEFLNVGTTQHFHIHSIFCACRSQNSRIINGKRFRQRYISDGIHGGRIGNVTGQRSSNCCFGRNQIYLCILGTAAAQEVTVKCTQADSGRVGREPHSDAGTAGAFQNSGAAGKNIGQSTAVCQHPQNLLGTGRNRQAHRRIHGLALEHCRYLQHIVKRRIGTGADTDLIHLGALKRIHIHDIIGAVGAGNHWLQAGKIDGNDPVILSIGITGQRHVVLFSALGLEESSGGFIRGENGCGGTQFCAHIGDGSTLGNGQCIHTGATPFDNGTHAALNRQDPQDLKAHILCGYKGIQLTGQFHLIHFGHGDIVSTAAHGNSHIQAARTKRQHTNTASGGSMAIRANQGLTGLTKAFQMYLVTDTVTGTGEIDTMLIGNGLQIAVVIGIFKAGLKCIVIHISYTQLRLDSGNTHCFKLQVSHSTGSILGQCLIDFQRNLTAGSHVAGQKMCCNNFLCNCLTH